LGFELRREVGEGEEGYCDDGRRGRGV